jgi:hypothetical protein
MADPWRLSAGLARARGDDEKIWVQDGDDDDVVLMICHSTVQSSSTSGVLRLIEATAKRLLAVLVGGELDEEAVVVVPAWVAASAG